MGDSFAGCFAGAFDATFAGSFADSFDEGFVAGDLSLLAVEAFASAFFLSAASDFCVSAVDDFFASSFFAVWEGDFVAVEAVAGFAGAAADFSAVFDLAAATAGTSFFAGG